MSYNILLLKSNDKRLLADNIFNPDIDINLSIFKNLRTFLDEESIAIHTLDMYDPEKADLIIFFDVPYFQDIKSWLTILKHRKKNILFIYEPAIVNPLNYIKFFHKFFKKIFTWNDDLVDDKKYFKFNIQQSGIGLQTVTKFFNDKKFLAMVNGNKLPFGPFNLINPFGRELYSERVRAIEYFEQHAADRFDLYGRGWNKPPKHVLKSKIFGAKKYKVYKGEIADKIDLLSGYKYCLCFENLTNIKGYLTEKIFDCFKARCIPIYWGAANIENYVPQNCYIDYRDFGSYQKLLDFLGNIDETRYNEYIANIEELLNNHYFLNSWFEDGWIKFFSKMLKECLGSK